MEEIPVARGNSFILLFGWWLCVLLGESHQGYGFGMVASAIIVGAGLSTWASTYGVKMSSTAAKSLLLPVHVRRGAARRAVVHQQPEG
jgi:hypothetical protein